ncbi:MAG: HAD family hydrolase [Treponema sp.]|nr:HAD family hydrolase [Treponema sp.]
MNNVKAIIFDLDGTLLDTLLDLADSCNKSLCTCGYPARTVDEVRMFVGNGLGKLIERALPGGRENSDYEKVLSCMRKNYAENWNNKTKPYPGILAMLEKLKARGIKCGIVSNKPDEQVKELAQVFFSDTIQESAGENEKEGIRRKPFPDSVFTVMKKLGAENDCTVYAGDSDVDIQTAANAGIPCISVTWGFRSRDFLIQNGAKFLADNVEEFLDIISAEIK